MGPSPTTIGRRAGSPEVSVPQIRPFRALRFDPAVVGDPALVVAPPYDVIGDAERERLMTRHPANVVRLDLPVEAAGDEPDDRYRRAARILAGWRSDGTLRKDPHPSVYVYEQTYRVPDTTVERTQRGFFARLRLESFGPGSGVLPHERTLSGPKEDRYKLLRATGVNTSPVVGLFDDASGAAGSALAAITVGGPAAIDVLDDDGVRHRLWALPADGEGEQADRAAALIALASVGPITIADGHHRYETALRYRDERRMSRTCEVDPAFDYLLMLFLEASAEPLTVLPTHRLVRGLGDAAGTLVARASELFEVTEVGSAEELASRISGVDLARGGEGRFGLWTRRGGALLTARPEAFQPYLPAGGDALRGLDVTLLGVALERLAGIDASALEAGAVAYTKSAVEALAAVEAGASVIEAGASTAAGEGLAGVDAAFLLEGTPVASISAVARAGDVMPQKSTYFYPKALTGLLINPHEW